MKETYITQMPDEAGAFMEASRIISAAGANITRVSYNKAVDAHTLFIDVSGTQAQQEVISDGLKAIGYIQNQGEHARVMLLEFVLRDVPGAVLPVLELIHRYRFNISYISSQENGTGYQNFKMGLFVERPRAIHDFLHEATQLCEIHVIDYDESERVLDNTVFYMSFANRMAQKMQLSRDNARELMAQSNLIMQMLDERDEPPYKTFDYIGKYADMLLRYKGEAFDARITRESLGDGFELCCIEPPCGSNTYILRKGENLLFVDSGFACYAPEMYRIFTELYPDFEKMHRQIIVTHPDMDHCGLLNLFDEIYVSRIGWQHFLRETHHEPNFREQNPAHAPYCRISRILSKYFPPRMDCLKVVEGLPEDAGRPVCPIGTVTFCGKRLDIYRGNGGHAEGEVVIVDEAEKLVFSGDIVVNIAGFSKPQAAFNRLAPYLMTSVNMNSEKAAKERRYLMEMFSPATYIYCGGHGAILRPVKH